MTRTVSAAQAKMNFADCVRATERGESVVITRHGKVVAALVPAGDIEQLHRLRAAGPRAGLAGLAGGWRGAEALVAHLSGRRRTKPRTPVKLGGR
jgi:prevent-host-death family protein